MFSPSSILYFSESWRASLSVNMVCAPVNCEATRCLTDGHDFNLVDIDVSGLHHPRDDFSDIGRGDRRRPRIDSGRGFSVRHAHGTEFTAAT